MLGIKKQDNTFLLDLSCQIFADFEIDVIMYLERSYPCCKKSKFAATEHSISKI